MALLEIEKLNVRFVMPERTVYAVRDLDLTLAQGETLGIVGESGCGKTMTAYAVLRLIKKPGEITSGQIRYNGKDLRSLGDTEIRAVRGKEIAMIFQEPMSSLNPVFKIGTQITETLELHLALSKDAARARAIELLSMAGIPDAAKRFHSYPHELSGGMRQRVMIAMALSCDPKVLIADEPTTALDVTIQAQILDLILTLQKETQMSLMIISHDLGVISNVADRIAIMYAGEIIEMGNASTIFSNPMHPYTIGLFEAIPRIGIKTKRLATIPGSVPTLIQEPKGCAYFGRCPKGDSNCAAQKIPLIDHGDKHLVRCIKA